MANHAGPVLSRLIRDRAYAAGALAAQAARVERAKIILARVIAEFDEAQALVTQLDTRIKEGYGLDPGQICSIRLIPKSGLFPYGELTRELVRVLKEAAPQPITTTAIIADVAQALSLPIETAAQREVTRVRIVKQLQKYARKGAIERLHDLRKTKVGVWRWIGLQSGGCGPRNLGGAEQ